MIEPHGIPRLRRWGEYVVPWFVTIWKRGKPEFRIIDPARQALAIRERRCWICGELMRRGRYAFAVGPMCTVNRVSAEPPQHRACAVYAATHCPFLNDPTRARRPLDSNTKVIKGGGVARNPGVVAIWCCKKYRIDRGIGGERLFRMGRPSEVLWFHRGRVATREVVVEAFARGCQVLETVAAAEGSDSVAEIRAMQARARRFFPAASR